MDSNSSGKGLAKNPLWGTITGYRNGKDKIRAWRFLILLELYANVCVFLVCSKKHKWLE